MSHTSLTVALEAADKAYRASIKAAVAGFAMKPCNRCNGKGSAHFIGADRAPGICFKCAGKGTIYATKAIHDEAALIVAKAELVRLRACWVAVNTALKAAREEDKLGSSWVTRSNITELERRLASYQRSGKAAAQAV